jgi:hypothetical protein
MAVQTSLYYINNSKIKEMRKMRIGFGFGHTYVL